MKWWISLVIFAFGSVKGEDNENGAAWQYTVTVDQLITMQTLQDGDVIEMIVVPDACVAPDEVAFEINLIAPVTAWKAIYLHNVDITDDTLVMLESESNQLPHVAHVKHSDIVDSFYLVFWKDRTLGKRGEYWVSDANTRMQAGKHYKFLWRKD